MSLFMRYLLINFSYALINVQSPIPIKPTPATYCSVFSLTYCDTIEPAATPMAEVKTSANAAPTKTVNLLLSLSAANNIVASCVLSPNSAIKTEVNTVIRIFRSISTSLTARLLIPTEERDGRETRIEPFGVRRFAVVGDANHHQEI